MRKKIVETCEMCSAEVRNPTTIKVEGALLRVCPNCTSFGNIVEAKTKGTSSVTGSKYSQAKRSPTRRTKSRSVRRSRPSNDEKILIDGYGEEIKRARMKKKLTQEKLSQLTGVSVPYIRAIEAEKMRPTDQVATKLEQELNIDLFEDPEADLQYQEKSKKKGLTVGDIVSIKRLEFD